MGLKVDLSVDKTLFLRINKETSEGLWLESRIVSASCQRGTASLDSVNNLYFYHRWGWQITKCLEKIGMGRFTGFSKIECITLIFLFSNKPIFGNNIMHYIQKF